MFYNDHNPPHFHAKYGDFKAVIAIDTGEVVEGRLPPRVLGLVQEWREYHKAELNEDWNLARMRKALKRIEPLEWNIMLPKLREARYRRDYRIWSNLPMAWKAKSILKVSYGGSIRAPEGQSPVRRVCAERRT